MGMTGFLTHLCFLPRARAYEHGEVEMFGVVVFTLFRDPKELSPALSDLRNTFSNIGSPSSRVENNRY